MQSEEQSPSGGVTPHIAIREGKAAEAIDFYQRAFGAEELMRHPSDDGRIMHAHLRINGGSVMLHDDFPEHSGAPMREPAGTILHLQVDDADAWWNRAVEAGCEVRFPLADQFWGDRYGQLRDPYGHTWSIGEPAKSS
jgi:PhnB protein